MITYDGEDLDRGEDIHIAPKEPSGELPEVAADEEDLGVDPDFLLELSELFRLFRADKTHQEDWTFDNFMYWVAELAGDIDGEEAQAE